MICIFNYSGISIQQELQRNCLCSFKALFYHLFLALIILGELFVIPDQISEAQEISAEQYKSDSQVVLTINPALDRKAISPYLYGINIANWCPWYYTHSVEQRLRDAKVEVVRLGATNMERYNFKNNRMYNVITRQNEYLSLSWESFVEWTKNSLNAEPFLQMSVFGNLASDYDSSSTSDYVVNSYSDTTNSDSSDMQTDSYSHLQSTEEVIEWAASAGDDVKFWGIGNEPWIAWKRHDYPQNYADSAHGDQVLNFHTSYDYYFNRFATVARSIKQANPNANTLGPTPANWWFYWFNDYSPLCPVTEIGTDARSEDSAWQIMSNPDSMWNRSIFPDRGENPAIAGWEADSQKSLPQYLLRMRSYETEQSDTDSINSDSSDNNIDNSTKRIANYMDVHRYIRCITEYDAIQEPRGLFQEDFASWDMETLFSGVKTNLLNRLNSAINAYYPGTLLSFSEYGYFYWDGYPSIAQISAVGTMDFLGFFARGGVNLACNWYVGEPNQSGEDLTHAQHDSARQAMFDESGNPNPQYWSFYMMSNFFRGTSIKAESSDWDRFSVHACENENGDYVVFAVNKGSYDRATGNYVANMPPVTATIEFSDYNSSSSANSSTGVNSFVDVNSSVSANTLHLSRILRYGIDDPYMVEMDISDIENIFITESDGQRKFTFDFHPLAIYAFIFSGSQKQSDTLTVDNSLNINNGFNKNSNNADVLVTPDIVYFNGYDTGKITNEDGTIFTHAIKITNRKPRKPASWSIRSDSKKPLWLNVEGGSNGLAYVTDSIYLIVDRTGLASGSYETEIYVNTGEQAQAVNGQNKSYYESEQVAAGDYESSEVTKIRVIMDVIPGEANGEKMVTDFETGSLAHTLNLIPPYSVGWWDGHGMPNDRNMPYLYDFYVDRTYDKQNREELIFEDSATNSYKNIASLKNRLGGAFCMKIEFDRSNGDTENGKLYQSFGTYGHGNATADWEGYDAFEFDIKTDTVDSTHTNMLMIISDKSGNKGKPAINLTDNNNLGITNNLLSSNTTNNNTLVNHNDLMKIEDGHWKTVSIPLNSRFFDWRHPEGQNGSETKMDFSAITQVEFVPWSGDATKQGSIWLDNLRLTRADDKQNQLPVAVIEKNSILALPNKSVTLNGSQSYDPDNNGEIIDYRWISSNINSITSDIEKLSDNTIASPIFLSSKEGIYTYDLVVTDNNGVESRNIAQVVVTVSQNMVPDDSSISIGGGSSGEGCFCSTILNFRFADGEDISR
ncbi:MAG: hypothetical protein HQK70_04065 [Desulfamplus sp.]|nr:hypothetical protein [Desulfamplus sp.]